MDSEGKFKVMMFSGNIKVKRVLTADNFKETVKDSANY